MTPDTTDPTAIRNSWDDPEFTEATSNQAPARAREAEDVCDHPLLRRCTYPGQSGPVWICANDDDPSCHFTVESERDELRAEVGRMQGAARLAMSALTAALTTMQTAARLPEGHEDDADLLHETVAMLPVQIDRLTKERDELRATVDRVEALADCDKSRDDHVHRWIDGSCLVDGETLRAALAGGAAADAPTSSAGGA